MVDFYVRKCEKDGFNFFKVPLKYADAVREKITSDGYVINPDGTVVKG